VESHVAASGAISDITTSPDLHWNEPHASLPQNASYVAANGAAGDANYAFDRDSRWPLADALEGAGDVTVNGGFGHTISALSWSLPHAAANRVYVGMSIQENILANTNLATPVATLAPINHSEREACTHIGCTATFRRPSDLRRHTGMHSPPKLLCLFKSCERRFYRLDKLRDHQRKKHKTAV
jgi:hypothetical protein